ncbi:MAG: hypothetical protein KDD76_02420, partial [Rickettsiales bacterium]|nr:hypothetical protein [Rickettsiales bacterium]
MIPRLTSATTIILLGLAPVAAMFSGLVLTPILALLALPCILFVLQHFRWEKLGEARPPVLLL